MNAHRQEFLDPESSSNFHEFQTFICKKEITKSTSEGCEETETKCVNTRSALLNTGHGVTTGKAAQG